MSKKTLAVELSKAKKFENPKDSMEQHATDPDIAAQVLWTAYMNGWIKGKTIADFGAGTGVLGIGCLLLGAKKVLFLEKDRETIKLLEENIARFKTEYEELGIYEILNKDVKDVLDVKADLVIQNPPFGTRDKHADREFLEKATNSSERIISMHKSETDEFIKSLLEKKGYKVMNADRLRFPLRMSLEHHRKKTEYIRVTCWFAERNS